MNYGPQQLIDKIILTENQYMEWIGAGEYYWFLIYEKKNGVDKCVIGFKIKKEDLDGRKN